MQYKEFKDVRNATRFLGLRETMVIGFQYGCSSSAVSRVSLPFKSVRDKYGYPSLYFRKTARRLSTPASKFLSGVDSFVSSFERVVSAFDKTGLLSSYDKEVVLPATCGLSYVPTLHFDLDEKGELGHSRRFLFPEWLAQPIADKYRRAVSRIDLNDLSLSLKRGTNLGWPTQKSNSSRIERDVLLALHVSLTQGAKTRGMSLSDTTQFLSQFHGEAFAVAGERLQHTDRVIPYFCSDMQGYSWHVQPRVRGIYFSPKYAVAWNRGGVKRFLKAMMTDSLHPQDRSVLRSWFERHSSSDWEAISIDVSRFDQSLGGSAGRQILQIISYAVDQRCANLAEATRTTTFADFDTEFSFPMLVRTSSDLYLTKGAEILSSGLSTTSLIGTVYSECLCHLLASIFFGESYEQVKKAQDDRWSALSWGDDVVFAIKKSVFPFRLPDGSLISSLSEALPYFSKQVELEFSEEPTLKFLGQNYHMRNYTDAPLSYAPGRFIQQQFFPERIKKGPNAVIGLIARTEMLDSSYQKVVFDQVMNFHDMLEIAPFKWSDRDVVLKRSVDELLSESSDVSLADDVLNVFTHGLEADDIAHLDIGLNEEFAALLAQSVVKLDDPIAFLKDVAGFSDNRILSLLASLRKGELSAWPRALSLIKQTYGGSLNRNDSYY